MSRTATKVLALVGASSLAVLGFFITKPAFAGTNGQEVRVCQKPSENYQTMRVQGSNQKGDRVTARYRVSPGSCGTTAGLVWVGDVVITLTDSEDSSPDRAISCKVPKEGKSPITCN